jgi:hypothetical protein
MLELGRADALWILKQREIPKVLRAKALFLLGYIEVIRGNGRGGVPNLEKAIALHPNAPYAPWAELLAAEEYFESTNFSRAYGYYLKHYQNRQSPFHPIARYKLAWTLVNLNQLAKAESVFKEIIQSQDPQYGKDSLKDLAFLMIRFRAEPDIIKMAKNLYGSDSSGNEYKQFLMIAYGVYESKQTISLKSPILLELLKIEDDPQEKARLYLSAVKGTRKTYAHRDYEKTLRKLYEFLEEESIAPRQQKTSKISSDLDLETQLFVRAYFETFTDKVRSPGNEAKTDLAQTLYWAIPTYLDNFPGTNAYSEMYSLWNYTCAKQKNDQCLIDIAERSQKDSRLGSQQKRDLYLDRIAALERLHTKDKEKWREQLKKDLEFFVTFYAAPPIQSTWVQAIERLIEMLNGEKDFSDSLKFAELRQLKSPSADGFYTIQWVRFQSGNFRELIAAVDARPRHSGDPRVKSLYRESALKLSEASQSDGDVKTFVRYTKLFIENSENVAKAMIAYDNLFSNLNQRRETSVAKRELLAIPAIYQKEPQIIAHAEKACLDFVYGGDFVSCLQIAALYQPRSSALKSIKPFLEIGVGRSPDLNKVDNDKVYAQVESSVLLLDPKAFLQSYRARKSYSAGEKKKIYFALELAQLASAQNLPREWQGPLQEVLPEPEFKRSLLVSSSTEALGGFVAKAGDGAPLEEIVARNNEIIQKVRKGLTSDLKDRPFAQRIEIVTQVRSAEQSMSELIQSAPSPEGLDGKQQKLYSAGIAKAAKGYLNQVEEYSKMIDKLSQQEKDYQVARAAKEAPPFKSGTWPWPSELMNSDDYPGIKTLIRSQEFKKLYFLVQILKEQKKINDDTYYRYWAGALLSQNASPAMRKYVFDELMSVKMGDVVESWRDI